MQPRGRDQGGRDEARGRSGEPPGPWSPGRSEVRGPARRRLGERTEGDESRGARAEHGSRFAESSERGGFGPRDRWPDEDDGYDAERQRRTYHRDFYGESEGEGAGAGSRRYSAVREGYLGGGYEGRGYGLEREQRNWAGDPELEDREAPEFTERYGDVGNGTLRYGRTNGDPDARRRGPGGAFAGVGPKSYRRSDERLAEEINERLTRHPEIDPREVTVEVRDREVTLRGTVADRRTKHLVEDVAESCFGVRDVTNLVRVERAPDRELP